MTAEQATPAGRTPPPGRYGRSPRTGKARWRMWVFAAVALLAGAAAAYVGYRNLGSAPIEAQRVAFAEQPGDAMSITIDVQRDDPDRPGVCIVRVRNASGAESGRKEMLVSPGAGGARLSTTIRSAGKPVTADVFGCSYDVPVYLSRSLRPTG